MWRDLRDALRAKGVETAELDARLLAEAAFGLTRLELVNRERMSADPTALARFEGFAARRLAGEPVTRILGEREFYGRVFRLGAATLVPRPETEALVDIGIEVLAGLVAPRLLDLGTGTGCIAISLAAELPAATAVAVDLSAEALVVAEANAFRHGVGERIEFRRGSWFESLNPGERFDLIVSNPPYIESAEIGRLDIEVREHDPILALDGGPDGLGAYRSIAQSAARFLVPGGVLLFEIGWRQAEPVSDLVAAHGFGDIAVRRDLAGHDRVVMARRRR
jgi:release factor glutamine methyltransferase